MKAREGQLPEQQGAEFQKELQLVKISPHYKKLDSVYSEKGGIRKVFSYHYAEEKRWHLGKGSYGEVYICFFEEVVTQKIYKFALKQIAIPSNITEVKKIEDTVATTRQEIRSLIKLRDNPNIIKIEDVIADREHKLINLVLEYCNSKDLESFFEQERMRGQLKSEDEIVFYFNQLLNAFRDLYKYNIIHRDVKPANIFVHNKVLKVGDFGLSQQLFEKKENLHEHRMIGTLVTSAPQLIFKEPYTNKCDIYSLGLILYWMIFQRFPFQHIDCFDKDQLLKQSLSLEGSSSFKCSPEMASLLKAMLAYKEDDRIGWQALFDHPVFKRLSSVESVRVLRDTIGRNIHDEDLMEMLENTLPTEFYKYINEDSEIEMTGILDRGSEKGATQSLKTVVKEIINFNFKVNFLKMLLNEVFETGYEEKIKKSKLQFLVVRDLLRLGIDSYINYLNGLFLDQLNGYGTLRILDLSMLNEIGGSKLYRNYVQNFRFEAETYRSSQKRPKLSKEERAKLEHNCKKFDIVDKFNFLLSRDLLRRDESEFLEQIKRCIVELIYFVKEEIRSYQHHRENLAEDRLKRYRQLILLIHHLNMMILLPKIFPACYDPNLDYDIPKFEKNQLYLSNHHFDNLALHISQIIARFEN